MDTQECKGKWMLRAGYFPMEYAGMNYKQASIEAARLIEEAHNTGKWFPLVEQLVQLRTIMNRVGSA